MLVDSFVPQHHVASTLVTSHKYRESFYILAGVGLCGSFTLTDMSWRSRSHLLAVPGVHGRHRRDDSSAVEVHHAVALQHHHREHGDGQGEDGAFPERAPLHGARRPLPAAARHCRRCRVRIPVAAETHPTLKPEPYPTSRAASQEPPKIASSCERWAHQNSSCGEHGTLNARC